MRAKTPGVERWRWRERAILTPAPAATPRAAASHCRAGVATSGVKTGAPASPVATAAAANRVSLRVLLGAAWVGGLFAPAGFWMRTRGDALFAAAALATGLAGAPVFTPLVATPVLQWLAAALGILAGAAVRVVLSRRLHRAAPGVLASVT